MGLFANFKETIFLKEDSELERKIIILKELQKKYPNNEKIKNDLLLANLGLAGEKEIAYELKNANLGMYVLHDINLVIDEYKAQIDYIVLTKLHTYFIECKNLIGNITVNQNGDFIREYYLGKQKIKTGIYSPLRQVERQKEIYKKIWIKNHSVIGQKLYEKRFDNYYKTLVVMAKSENMHQKI